MHNKAFLARPGMMMWWANWSRHELLMVERILEEDDGLWPQELWVEAEKPSG